MKESAKIREISGKFFVFPQIAQIFADLKLEEFQLLAEGFLRLLLAGSEGKPL